MLSICPVCVTNAKWASDIAYISNHKCPYRSKHKQKRGVLNRPIQKDGGQARDGPSYSTSTVQFKMYSTVGLLMILGLCSSNLAWGHPSPGRAGSLPAPTSSINCRRPETGEGHPHLTGRLADPNLPCTAPTVRVPGEGDEYSPSPASTVLYCSCHRLTSEFRVRLMMDHGWFNSMQES